MGSQEPDIGTNSELVVKLVPTYIALQGHDPPLRPLIPARIYFLVYSPSPLLAHQA